MSSPTPQKINVRRIISLFENQSFAVSNEPSNLVKRAKSMSDISRKPVSIKTQEPEKNSELAQIHQEIEHLSKNLTNNYRTYSKETHIYYQNQIVFLLTDLANTQVKTNSKLFLQKVELLETLKKLNKKLNALLPSSGQVVRREKLVKTPSTEERRRVFADVRRKESVEEKVEHEHPNQDEEVDSSAVSVKNLKEIFEKNSNENEGKVDFGAPKNTISLKKSSTFHGSSDFKYVPYSQRLKSLSQENDEEENNARLSPLLHGSGVNGEDDYLTPDSISSVGDEQNGRYEEEEGEEEN